MCWRVMRAQEGTLQAVQVTPRALYAVHWQVFCDGRRLSTTLDKEHLFLGLIIFSV